MDKGKKAAPSKIPTKAAAATEDEEPAPAPMSVKERQAALKALEEKNLANAVPAKPGALRKQPSQSAIPTPATPSTNNNNASSQPKTPTKIPSANPTTTRKPATPTTARPANPLPLSPNAPVGDDQDDDDVPLGRAARSPSSPSSAQKPPVDPAAQAGASSGDPSSPDTPSGLPKEYYERYTRTYYIGGAKRGDQPSSTAPTRRPTNNSRGYSNGSSSPYQHGAGMPPSSVGSSDHLSAAVDNLFKMVEQKVVQSLPKPPPPQLQESPSAYAQFSTPQGQGQQPQMQQLNGRRPGDRSSWTSTAIHSEVSRLYRYGADDLEAGRAPPMPGSQQMRELELLAETRAMIEEKERIAEQKRARIAVWMFFLGFLLFPCWFVGATLRRTRSGWKKANLVMAIIVILGILAGAGFVIATFVVKK
ncbi:hypothetical protein HK101_005197 [Irineochytrium annulatum]|nr:hypothetical protein HK101_005197 [Irineochytrium annulatum]